MKQVKRQLLYLAVGELAAAGTFIVLYISLNRALSLGMASYAAFSYLTFILLQGSIYWFYRARLIMKKENFGLAAKKSLKFMRQLNMLILAALGGLMPFINRGKIDFLIAMAILCFGIIEYINYYWYRLSYGRSGFNLRLLLKTKLRRSSISKLIDY